MSVFNSFFMGGFECADHINRAGERVNLLRETEHDARVAEDYKLLVDLGIKTVREGVCWSNVEKSPFSYDFSEVKIRIDAAARLGIQQIWDLCHFGYPDGLYPTHPQFCSRFAALCEAFAGFYKSVAIDTLFVVPINEISFLSWHSGEVRGTVPFAIKCGFDIKYHLCKAAIAGIESLRAVLPTCRIILVEPIIKIHPNSGSDHDALFTRNEAQFQAMDMISGRMCPELGGAEANLDILGFNYYWDCQWQDDGPPLDWPEDEKACGEFVALQGSPQIRGALMDDVLTGETSEAPDTGYALHRETLSGLLQTVHSRYARPLFLAETGHFGSGRPQWVEQITVECLDAIDAGVQLLGVCIYPVIDRPDWDDLSFYHNSGIWDLEADKNRTAAAHYVMALRNCMDRVCRHHGTPTLQRATAMEQLKTPLSEKQKCKTGELSSIDR